MPGPTQPLRPRIALVLAVLFAALAAPAPAGAVTIDVEKAIFGPNPIGSIRILGGPEDDDLLIAVRDENVVISSAVPLQVPPPCVRLDDGSASCPYPPPYGVNGITVYGGEGADHLAVDGPLPAALDGQGGDDVLDGGDGDDQLTGGGGHDTLRGHLGNDALFYDSDPDGDVLQGGPGIDQLTVNQLWSSLRVDLAVGTVDMGGVTSSIAGVEDVSANTWSAPAELVGDNGPNRLSVGGGEPAHLDGRGGDDQLTGSLGVDRIDGGDGADEISFGSGDRIDGGGGGDVLIGERSSVSADRPAATLACGDGVDTVRTPWDAVVPGDCERLDMAAFGVAGRPRLQPERIAVPIVLGTRRCGYSVQLRDVAGDAAVTALRRFRTPRHVLGVTPHLPLTASARRLAAHGSLSTAVLVVRPMASCPRRGAWKGSRAFTFPVALS